MYSSLYIDLAPLTNRQLSVSIYKITCSHQRDVILNYVYNIRFILFCQEQCLLPRIVYLCLFMFFIVIYHYSSRIPFNLSFRIPFLINCSSSTLALVIFCSFSFSIFSSASCSIWFLSFAR